jgi:hypothetical protein
MSHFREIEGRLSLASRETEFQAYGFSTMSKFVQTFFNVNLPRR